MFEIKTDRQRIGASCTRTRWRSVYCNPFCETYSFRSDILCPAHEPFSWLSSPFQIKLAASRWTKKIVVPSERNPTDRSKNAWGSRIAYSVAHFDLSAA